jgi:hypothetical protein
MSSLKAIDEQARQSIQSIRNNIATRVRTVTSRCDCPSVGAMFVHSRMPTHRTRRQRTRTSRPSMRTNIFKCQQFYYTLLAEQVEHAQHTGE